MKIVNEVKITFPSRSVNESFARVSVSAFASQLDPAIDVLSDIKTAVSEAVTNCIVHAYKNTVGIIEINMRITEDNWLVIRVRDRGCGIEDVKQAMEPLYTTSPEEERAGLGFSVMENFMDRLSVRSTVGVGTTVTMQKKISSR